MAFFGRYPTQEAGVKEPYMGAQQTEPTSAARALDGAVANAISRARAIPVVAQAIDLLARQLPANLTYHAKSHTDDVLAEAMRYATIDGLSAREVELLAIAAAFHDTGFVKSLIANEALGADFARKAMRLAGTYSEDEIALVEQMIIDTTLVELPNGPQQIPSTKLSRYLLDADLSNLGREDFFDKGELQRRELGIDEAHFRKRSLQLLTAHRWFTDAARNLRQKKKDENLLLLKSLVEPSEGHAVLSFDRVGFLAKLPLLLNSSLDTRKVIKAALNELKTRIGAEAATIFLFDRADGTLCFWAMQGPDNDQLERSKIPASRGIVGWVLEHQDPIIVNDAQNDPRLFREIEESTGFHTRNLMCAPLTVRIADRIGAVEVLNRMPGDFSPEDLEFLTQFAGQIALAIENSQLYESVKQHSRNLEILDQRKTEVMKLIAHEFRNPVQQIGSSASALADPQKAEPAALASARGEILAGVERLETLISEIRNLSFATSADFAVTRAKVGVAQLLEGVVRSFAQSAAGRNISLTQAVTTDAVAVEGDSDLLSLALSHLVSNALAYTPDSGHIQVKAFRNGGMIHIEIRDSGIGIPEEQQKLIFEKFYRLEASPFGDRARQMCLGLGLPTVQAILRAHGSTCNVASTPGKGSVFSFALPGADG